MSVTQLPIKHDVVRLLRELADTFEREGAPEVLVVIGEYKTTEKPIVMITGLARPNAHIMGMLDSVKLDIYHNG